MVSVSHLHKLITKIMIDFCHLLCKLIDCVMGGLHAGCDCDTVNTFLFFGQFQYQFISIDCVEQKTVVIAFLHNIELQPFSIQSSIYLSMILPCQNMLLQCKTVPSFNKTVPSFLSTLDLTQQLNNFYKSRVSFTVTRAD